VFLKRIELFGFKSFADKTEIEFTNGISALLGPNGCGKSNVVDAIKWVLGEQATKSLRAEKMEDIIFNGTEDRKPLNVAEVTLTLENDENLLSLDTPEIAVKRRLFRNGDSEYYINNTPVKLRDVRELFLDTGIGKSAYSIMEQGKIDQILSTKPEERRYIFEEAASITKYKARGLEADRKLRRTDENIRQVESILSEVKRTHDSLQKQADKTRTYHELREKRFELDRNIHLLRLREYLNRQDKKNKELEDITGQRKSIKELIDSINEHLEENLDQVNSMETELNDSNKRLYGLTIEKSNITSQISIINERVRELEEKIQQDRSREQVLQKRKEQLGEEREEKLALVDEYSGRLDEVSKNIEEFKQRIGSSEQRVVANEDEEKRLELANLDFDVQMTGLQADLQNLTDDIVRELDEGLKASDVDLDAQAQASEALRSAISEIGRLVQRQRRNLGDLHSPAEQGQLLFDLHSKTISELDALRQELETSFERYSAGAPDFLRDFLAPEGIITKKREIDDKLRDIRGNIETNRRRVAELAEENKNLRGKIQEYRGTLQELLVNQERLKAQQQAIINESDSLEVQMKELEAQILENRQKIAEDEGRLSGLQGRIKELIADKDELQKTETKLQKELQSLEKGISNKNKDLSNKEKELQKNMETLGKVQSRHESVQMEITELTTEIRNLYGNFRERYSRDLSEFEELVFEIKDDIKTLRDRSNSVKDRLKALGSVNLMALEEYNEVKERYDFLSGQLKDLYDAKKDLEEVTAQIRDESARMFLETYEKIRRNFHAMFRRLFGGGRAELKLTDPDNVLESGIEFYAQPPGKKLENIALLSGGERSLTAVAMLFATYMVKPSPFCLLDEIDAALDESNVGRFINMLMEFANTSQFIVITHNKKTVAGASTLLGVTMEESGVSKAVSIRLGAEDGTAKMYHER
jgi:chromosome segregation protein